MIIVLGGAVFNSSIAVGLIKFIDLKASSFSVFSF